MHSTLDMQCCCRTVVSVLVIVRVLATGPRLLVRARLVAIASTIAIAGIAITRSAITRLVAFPVARLAIVAIAVATVLAILIAIAITVAISRPIAPICEEVMRNSQDLKFVCSKMA